MSDAPTLPTERLAAGARWLWRTEGLIATAVAAVVLGVIGLPQPIQVGAPALTFVVLAVAVPELRWRLWRLDVDDVRLDLRRGGLIVRRTVVPIVRIQHVDAASDALDRLFGLATVTVHTAGGKVTVPGLEERRAHALAHRIATLARPDDD